MHAISRPDLVGPSYAQNHHRVARLQEIEKAISAWTSQRTVGEVEVTMKKANVPVGRVNNVQDVLGNEQVLSRGAVREVPVRGGNGQPWTVKMQGTFPVIEGVDPQPDWAGPELGAHTDEVLSQELGLSDGEIKRLRDEGVIG